MYMSALLCFYVRGLHLENISILVVVVLYGYEHSHTALCDFSKYLREVIDALAPAKCARNIQEEFFSFQFWHVDLHDLDMRIVLSTSALMIICVDTSVMHVCPFSPAPHNRVWCIFFFFSPAVPDMSVEHICLFLACFTQQSVMHIYLFLTCCTRHEWDAY